VSLDQRFAEAMGQLLGPDFPDEIALAVSGGGDSMAMLSLAHNWTRHWGVKLWVVTVDHGLRADSAAEAQMVAQEAKLLGWPHATLRWNWDGAGNVMDAARRARLQLINGWRGAVRHVLLAHTRDDLAETFVMRLQRGAGVDGLSAMQSLRQVDPGVLDGGCDGAQPEGESQNPMMVVRPCLGMSRTELRHYARVLKTPWVEDPTNSDTRYERARIRGFLTQLNENGLGSDVLADAALRMADAKEALRRRAADVWDRCGFEGVCEDRPTGEIILKRDPFAQVERDTQMRLLQAALRYVSGAEYAPRRAALEGLFEAIMAGRGGTLHGCEALVEKDEIIITREYQAVRDMAGLDDWDGRWMRNPQSDFDAGNCVFGALGDAGWAQLGDDRLPLPYRRARATPALWCANTGVLKASPLMADFGAGHAIVANPAKDFALGFRRFLLSH
jgi:tRNA(Ile)-lysidine synthase